MKKRLIYGFGKNKGDLEKLNTNICKIKLKCMCLSLDIEDPGYHSIDEVALDDRFWEIDNFEFYLSGYNVKNFGHEVIVQKLLRRFIKDPIFDSRIFESNKYRYETELSDFTDGVIEVLNSPDDFGDENKIVFDMSNKTHDDCFGKKNTRVYAEIIFENLESLGDKTLLTDRETLSILDDYEFLINDPLAYTVMKVRVLHWQIYLNEDKNIDDLNESECSSESEFDFYFRNYVKEDFSGSNYITSEFKQIIIDAVDRSSHALVWDIYQEQVHLVDKCLKVLSKDVHHTPDTVLNVTHFYEDDCVKGITKNKIKICVTFENLEAIK
ncbi:MAG: hypothetical protein ACRCX2_38995 [Paraclostridium sp.]